MARNIYPNGWTVFGGKIFYCYMQVNDIKYQNPEEFLELPLCEYGLWKPWMFSRADRSIKPDNQSF